MPAPARWPEASASGMAATSTTPPREVLTRNEPRRHLGDRRRVDDVKRLVGQRAVRAENVRLGQQLVESFARRTPSDLSRPSGT